MSNHTVTALPGAFLGAALGANCFLAMESILGPAAALCGIFIALFAVQGGELTSNGRGRTRTLHALPWVLLFSCLGCHFSAALDTAPGNPAKIWQLFLSLDILSTRYWLQLAGLTAVSFITWAVLFYRSGRERAMLIRALQPVRTVQDPAPAEMEFFLPDFSWVRPHLLVRRFSQGLWMTVLFLCLWLDRLTGHEALWSRAAVGMGFSLLLLASLQGPSSRLCAGAAWLYVRWEGRLWKVPLKRTIDLELRVPVFQLVQVWDLLPQVRRTAIRASIASVISSGKIDNFRIERPMAVDQSGWEWILTGSRGVQHMIPKIYPGFSPLPGELEQVQTAPPVRWLNPAVTILILSVCLAAGILM